MKKFLFMMLMMLTFTISASAQVWYFRTTAYAQATVYNGHYYWSDWQSSNMTITINLDNDIITVYSPRTQIYRVVTSGTWFNDNDGGKQLAYTVIDQDADRGTIRLRIQADGTSQLYVDFSNIAWVYNVVRTS